MITEQQEDKVLALSELLHTLVMSHVPAWQQQRLNLYATRDYCEDLGNDIAAFYLEGKYDHDTYHRLISGVRMAWVVINQIISEVFEEKVERQMPLGGSRE